MAIKRLITLSTIRAEKIDRSRSWIANEMAAGRFPRPVVQGNPNLWDEAEIERWLNDFVAACKTSDSSSQAARVAKARAARHSPTGKPLGKSKGITSHKRDHPSRGSNAAQG